MSPLPPDPYKTLGVAKDAQIPEIRSAHRKLVLKCHPDKVQDPKLKAEKADEFQRVQQAYELLTDDAERRKYDDKVKVEELRKQAHAKVHISTPRQSSRHNSADFEIRTTPSRYPSRSAADSPPSAARVYSFTQYDEEYIPGARIFETTRSSRREYSDKPSKRDSEKEKERERRKAREAREEEARRIEKQERKERLYQEAKEAVRIEKEAKRAEKRRKEKIRSKDMKRETEEKHTRYSKLSDEGEDVLPPKPERKRSSGPINPKKYDDDYDRRREETARPPPVSRPAMTTRGYSNVETYARHQADAAASYIATSIKRSNSYANTRVPPPHAPTPPTPAKASAYPPPKVEEYDYSDEEIHRSSAGRRGSAGLSRERSTYRKSSRDVLDDPIPASSSPAARSIPSLKKAAAGSAAHMSSSPPWELPRSQTMPVGTAPPRGPPTRSNTELPNRGRYRTRYDVPVEEDSDEHDRRAQRKSRPSRRTHSPEQIETRYQFDGGRTYLVEGYNDDYPYHQIHVSETRQPIYHREASYSASPSMSKYHNVKYADYGDVYQQRGMAVKSS